MLDIFGDIFGSKSQGSDGQNGQLDKMASWAGAGRFYVWTRSSPINLGQVNVWTRSVGKAEFFFEMLKSAVQKPTNLDHGKFRNRGWIHVWSNWGYRPEGWGSFRSKMPKFCVDKNGSFGIKHLWGLSGVLTYYTFPITVGR